MTADHDPEFVQYIVREERALLRFVMGLVPCMEEARKAAPAIIQFPLIQLKHT